MRRLLAITLLSITGVSQALTDAVVKCVDG